MSAATRLCAACGMCCNGVLFHTVRILPEDSVGELSALGLKLKRKRGERWLFQPCPAHGKNGCSIYAQRPQRCRRFECRQLQRVAMGEISEAEALAQIEGVKRRVAAIELLLEQSGKTDPKRPLSKRYERICADPVDASWEPEAIRRREQLSARMAELEAILDREFRVDPPVATGTDLLSAEKVA